MGLIVDYGPGTGGGDAIWQNGGTITDTRENPTRTTLDAKAQDAIQWLVDLRHRHQVVPSDEERKALGRAWSGEAAVSAAVQEANEQGTRIIRERAQRR